LIEFSRYSGSYSLFALKNRACQNEFRTQEYCWEKEENLLRKVLSERGQGLVEYALIMIMVAIVLFLVLQILGPAIGNIFSNIVANF